jgi:hypothetical protein
MFISLIEYDGVKKSLEKGAVARVKLTLKFRLVEW